MSLKDKAKAIHEAGAAERGNYSPAEGSVPLRMYNYWRNLDPARAPKTENFCHYWRVVLFWAPLWWVLEHIVKVVDTKAGRIAGVAGVAAFALYLISLGGVVALQGIGGLAAIAYAVTGLILGIWALDTRTDDDDDAFFNKAGWKYLFLFPVGLLVYGIGRGFMNTFGRIPSAGVDWIGKIALGVLLFGAVAAMGYVAFIDLAGFLTGLAIVVGLGVSIVGLSYLGTYLKMKHKAAVDARTTVVVEDWGYGYTTEKKVVEPSKVAKFFMAIGDFLNLVFQAVRVKKWKICPIVQIPTEK